MKTFVVAFLCLALTPLAHAAGEPKISKRKRGGKTTVTVRQDGKITGQVTTQRYGKKTYITDVKGGPGLFALPRQR